MRTKKSIFLRGSKRTNHAPLAGLVAEGSAPFGAMSNSVDSALKRATFSGMPVVKVSRGNAVGFVDPSRDPLAIAGSNLAAPQGATVFYGLPDQVRLLAAGGGPGEPTETETEATKNRLAQYQKFSIPTDPGSSLIILEAIHVRKTPPQTL